MSHMNQEEIDRNAELAKGMLMAAEPSAVKVIDRDNEELSMHISDGIANLLILAQESEVGIADALTTGAAHFCATYMEGMDPNEASAWLSAVLFPLTGERQFAEYIADSAIVLSGHQGRVESPEWGV